MDSNCSTRGQLLNPSPPLPSPSWAERVRGVANRGETRAKPPVNNSTPTRTIFSSTPAGAGASSLPSAHSQFLAWENCRRRGVPARLVLDTDGVTEEVSLWFRAGANVGGSTAASHAAAAHVVSGKRRRERARRRRRREERRREAEENLLPPGPPTAGGNTEAPDTPPAPPREPSPSIVSTVRARGYKARPLVVKRAKAALAASRASQRAAALAKRRGAAASQLSDTSQSPEKLRESGGDITLNITDAEGADGVGPSLDQTPEDIIDPTQQASAVTSEPDYNEELWENGICLNTRRPPWQGVFPPRGPKFCRFCEGVPMPNQDPDDKDFVCVDCNKLSTFQLVVKYAPRWRYYNSKSMFNLYTPPP